MTRDQAVAGLTGIVVLGAIARSLAATETVTAIVEDLEVVRKLLIEQKSLNLLLS